MKGLFVMFGRRSRDRHASISKYSVLPLTVALAIPAFVSIPLVYYSEEAKAVEVYWECTQEAPLTVGATTGHKRSVGYNTFNSGRSSGTLTVNCVHTGTEVTYENFGGGADSDYANYPDSTNGMTGANLIDSDGAITYFLRGSGEDANRARWAVERETTTGNPPKQYLIKACTAAGNRGKMCYVEATMSDGLADLNADQLNSRKIYWRLMTITPGTDGNRKSAITLTPLAAQVNGEDLVEDNQDKFIEGMYETDSGTATAVDSVLRNLNGLVKFKMVIDGLDADDERVRSAGGDATEQENIVHIKPGGDFGEVELQVTGGSVVTAGQQGVTNDNMATSKGSYGIIVSDAEEDWTGPVTVEVSGASRVETWASKVAGKHASGIYIDMGSNNNNVATVRVNTDDAQPNYPHAGLRVRSSFAHQPDIIGYETGNEDGIRGRFDTYGPESPAVLVRYPGGDGSVTVNLENRILTYRDSSSGIEVQLAEDTTTGLTPGPSSSGAYVKTSSPTGGIVYEFDRQTAVTTSGKASAGIIAEANYGTADPEDFHATIRIGDAIGTGARGETKIVVQNRITINDDKAGRNPDPSVQGAQGKSHGVLVIATRSDKDEITDALHPLYGRDWMVRTPRDVEIDVNAVIDMRRNGYAVALLGHTGRKNTVRVGLAGRLKAQGEALASGDNADKNAVLFWKADDTLSVAGHINGGSVNFGNGKDRLVMNGGVVGAFADNAVFPALGTVTAGSAIDFGDGDDTLELRSGIVRSPISKLEKLVKESEGDAAVGDVEFSDGVSGNAMEVKDGRLIVSGACRCWHRHGNGGQRCQAYY